MFDKSLSPEIQKLMEKIMKNPASRLFVPLGEEYLKAGMIDEAVQVLAEGIERHPTYVAARVMLGKIYLSQDRIPEAEKEFKQVILINPENILAHKKLSSIFQKRGEVQEAIESCKRVLTIDPSDKEAKELMAFLEKERVSLPLAEAVDSTTAPPSEVQDDIVTAISILPPPDALIPLAREREDDEKVSDNNQGIPALTKEASFPSLRGLEDSFLDS